MTNFASAPPPASASASSPSRSRRAVSPPVPETSAAAAAAAVAPPPPRERLFIRIPARKRPPAPEPALEPDLPAEQLASPVPSPAPAQVLVQSPLPPPSFAGRKRPRSKEAASPAKRALLSPGSGAHSEPLSVAEPVAGPSRLPAPNGEHVAVESVSPVRAKRQMKTAKSRVAPLPPPMKTAAVASSATAAAFASSAAERAASSSTHPVQARARQWPSLSTALTPTAPASLSEGEPVGRTMSVAEALAAPTPVEQATLSAPTLVEQAPAATTALSAPAPVAVEQARPLVPRKRTRSPSAERALAPTREVARAADADAAQSAAQEAPQLDAARTQPRSLTGSRLALVQAQHEYIPEGPSVTAHAVAPGRSPSPDRRASATPFDAASTDQPSTNGAVRTAPKPQDTSSPAAGPSTAPASTSPTTLQSPPAARPKIKLRLKLPRAPSPPPARDKTESPLGLCFPSPPALVALAPVPKPVPAELLAAFGGPGEEDSPTSERADELGGQLSEQTQASPATGRADAPGQSAARQGTPLARASAPDAARLAGERERAELGLSVASEPLHESTPSPLRSLEPAARGRSPVREELPRAESPAQDGGMDMATGGAPDLPPAVLSATVPRAPPSRANSPGPLSTVSSQGEQDVDVDLDLGMDMDMGVGMDMTEADSGPTRLVSPPPAVPVPRKRGRTPSPEQRALSSPRRSSTPTSPPALALDSFHSPPPLQASPAPLRSSPAPSPAAGSGPMSPPWSPVALPDEMMQLLALGAGPLPMPVFEPLPAPPPEEDDEVFGSDEDVDRLLEGVPPPPPTGEKKVAKKRKRRASGKRKSRAVVGDSD